MKNLNKKKLQNIISDELFVGNSVHLVYFNSLISHIKILKFKIRDFDYRLLECLIFD